MVKPVTYSQTIQQTYGPNLFTEQCLLCMIILPDWMVGCDVELLLLGAVVVAVTVEGVSEVPV